MTSDTATTISSKHLFRLPSVLLQADFLVLIFGLLAVLSTRFHQCCQVQVVVVTVATVPFVVVESTNNQRTNGKMSNSFAA